MSDAALDRAMFCLVHSGRIRDRPCSRRGFIVLVISCVARPCARRSYGSPGLVTLVSPASHLTIPDSLWTAVLDVARLDHHLDVLDLPARPPPWTPPTPGMLQGQCSLSDSAQARAHACSLTRTRLIHHPALTRHAGSLKPKLSTTQAESRRCVYATPHRGSAAGCMRVVNSSSEHAIGR
jgi:hypothetical protein